MKNGVALKVAFVMMLDTGLGIAPKMNVVLCCVSACMAAIL